MDIKSIEFNLPMNEKKYVVGKPVKSIFDERIITTIKDKTTTSDNDHIYRAIEIYTKDGLNKKIIDTPMTIKYEGGV